MAYVSLSVNMTIINPKVAGFENKEWLRSSEIKEDGLRFIERQRDDQPLQSWVFFFWEQAMPTSLEIEEVSFRLHFVIRGNEGYLQRELRYKVINPCFRETLVQIYF